MPPTTKTSRARRTLRVSPDVPFGRFARGPRSVADQMQRGMQSFCLSSDVWSPDVNVYERAGAFLVCVDLSGVDKRKLDVQVLANVMTLRGQRAVPRPPAGKAGHVHPPAAPPRVKPELVRVHLMEIDHGSFCRVVELPGDVDKHATTAVHENGLLWVTLPKL